MSNGTGGYINITAGNASCTGGSVNIKAGYGGSTSGAGGEIRLFSSSEQLNDAWFIDYLVEGRVDGVASVSKNVATTIVSIYFGHIKKDLKGWVDAWTSENGPSFEDFVRGYFNMTSAEQLELYLESSGQF